MGKSFALSLYGETYDSCFLSARRAPGREAPEIFITRLADMRLECLFTVTAPTDTPLPAGCVAVHADDALVEKLKWLGLLVALMGHREICGKRISIFQYSENALEVYAPPACAFDYYCAKELAFCGSAVGQYFQDKLFYYSQCAPNQYEHDMLANFWYQDYLDTEEELECVCDSLSLDHRRLITLFRCIYKNQEAFEPPFPLDPYMPAIRKYLVRERFLSSLPAESLFTLSVGKRVYHNCFLNLYTYREDGNLRLNVSRLCPDGYTIPGPELTKCFKPLPPEHIALEEKSGFLPALQAVGIVTEVVESRAWGSSAVPICRYDPAALARYTHINKSFLTLPLGIAGGQGLGKHRTERT